MVDALRVPKKTRPGLKDHSERGPVIWSRERERRCKGCVHPFEDGEPVSYMQWHGWAEEHMKTHTHTACPKCHLWVICKRKAARNG